MVYKVRVNDDAKASEAEILYLLKRFANNKQCNVLFTNDDDALSIGLSSENHISIAKQFNDLNINDLSDKGFINLSNGTPDYLSTAFFMLTCMQEYGDNDFDSIGRFKFESSYQYKLKNTHENIVQRCFDSIARIFRIPYTEGKTQFFLSHDIDTVTEAILQDGFYAIKKGRLDIFLSLLFKAAMAKPDWLNMDKIMRIESEYDCRSTFFWIVKQGKTDGLKNADYNFTSSKIQHIVTNTGKNGFENGIHKSASPLTFQQELQYFNEQPIANRYHYLKFNLPTGYDAVENAGLKIDASLGFAESIGFRNNYGLPFNPYNFEAQKAYSFVEVPLNVMDTTLYKYNRSSVELAEKNIFSFFEKHKSNCIISVLWHNNFFSDYKYKGYLPLYKKILSYIKDNNFSTINQQEIIKRYNNELSH